MNGRNGKTCKALEATGGDKKAAARLLGISRSTLYLKMEKYRLK